jgi:hypothetical protein
MFMQYWLVLYADDSKEMINAGVEIMMRTTIKLLEKKKALETIRVLCGAKTETGDHEEHE